jgi:hypothetical protein
MVFIRVPRQVRKAIFSLNHVKEGEPQFAVECISGEKNINPSIYYFKDKPSIPRFYQVHMGAMDYEKKGVRVLPVTKFIEELALQ